MSNSTGSSSQRGIPLETDDGVQQLVVVDDIENRHDLADPEVHMRQRGARGVGGSPTLELEEREGDPGEHRMVRSAPITAPFKVVQA